MFKREGKGKLTAALAGLGAFGAGLFCYSQYEDKSSMDVASFLDANVGAKYKGFSASNAGLKLLTNPASPDRPSKGMSFAVSNDARDGGNMWAYLDDSDSFDSGK